MTQGRCAAVAPLGRGLAWGLRVRDEISLEPQFPWLKQEGEGQLNAG